MVDALLCFLYYIFCCRSNNTVAMIAIYRTTLTIICSRDSRGGKSCQRFLEREFTPYVPKRQEPALPGSVTKGVRV